MNRPGIVACAILLSATLTPALAADRWEAAYFDLSDDTYATHNILRHGVPQIGHDLQGVGDLDWMVVRTKIGHSYEARVSGAGMFWADEDRGVGLPRFDRVDGNGAVLTPGAVTSDDTGSFDDFFGVGILSTIATGMSVRWISIADVKEYLRAGSSSFSSLVLPAGLTYDVEFYDTTYFIPRWNNSATQVTVFIVQNTTNATVSGNVLFYDATGIQLDSAALSIPEHGVQVLQTSTIGALAGQSGSATIVHTGGYGALAGKAVALEPATGFTFDTPLTPLPR